MRRIAFLIIVVICIGVFALVRNHPKTTSNQIAQVLRPSPTVEPFYEMTIPFLRAQMYQSTLGDRISYQSQPTYTSFLTNYVSNGLKINGLLTIPKGTPPSGGFPAIVFIHGYIAPTTYKTTERYTNYVDYLAKNGFVVFKIDLRGHGSSEGEATGSYYSSDYVTDTLNAYTALENADFVNKNKIGLWGHSMAGNIVMRAFAVKPTIPAVVIWAGAGYSYVDLAAYGLQDKSYHPPATANTQSEKRQMLLDTYGSPTLDSSYWRTVAPTNYLQDLKGAVELHQAKDDVVVSIHYNEDLNALLNKTTVTHQFFEYESGGHNISGASFPVAMQRTVEFFKKYL